MHDFGFLSRQLAQQRSEAEQRKLDEEKRKREEKLARKAAAREEARKNGTYETKKQREARLAAERRRASMLASGMISADTKPSKPKFERKKKKVVEKAPELFARAGHRLAQHRVLVRQRLRARARLRTPRSRS